MANKKLVLVLLLTLFPLPTESICACTIIQPYQQKPRHESANVDCPACGLPDSCCISSPPTALPEGTQAGCCEQASSSMSKTGRCGCGCGCAIGECGSEPETTPTAATLPGKPSGKTAGFSQLVVFSTTSINTTQSVGLLNATDALGSSSSSCLNPRYLSLSMLRL